MIPYTTFYNQPQTLVQFSSVTQSCPTLCDPMDHSTPGLPVHHQLPEFTQTHVHQVDDAIQPSHPLSSPSPPAFSQTSYWSTIFPAALSTQRKQYINLISYKSYLSIKMLNQKCFEIGQENPTHTHTHTHTHTRTHTRTHTHTGLNNKSREQWNRN